MDVEKLNVLMENQEWRDSLLAAMSGRSLLTRDGAPSASAVRNGSAVVPVLSFPGVPRSGLAQFVQLTFDDGTSNVRVGDGISPAVRERLRDITS